MRGELRPVRQSEVLLEWYRSEQDVDWQREHRESFERERRGQNTEELAADGVRLLKGALLQCRSTPQAFFDVHPTAWYATEISPAALAEATPIDQWGAFRSDSVRELVAVLPRLQRSKLSVPQLRHRLIVVSQSEQGKLLLLDGYRRSAGLLRANGADAIPVYWGICSQLADWDYYR